MNRIMMLLSLVVSVAISSAEEFLPVLQEGTRWSYDLLIQYPAYNEYGHPIGEGIYPVGEYITYVGDEVEIEGRICREIHGLYAGLGIEEKSFYVHEENGVLSVYIPEEKWTEERKAKYPGECPWQVIMNMNLHRGDKFHGMEVWGESYIYVAGAVRKRLKLWMLDTWVEGIGCQYAPAKYRVPGWSCMYSKGFRWSNGEEVFVEKDFDAPKYKFSEVEVPDSEDLFVLTHSDCTVTAAVATDDLVRLSIHTAEGIVLAQAEGTGSVVVSTSTFPPGVYMATAVCGSESRTLKWVQ